MNKKYIDAQKSCSKPVQNFQMTTEMKPFDDLSRQMWGDPLFSNAVLNWRFAAGYLYNLTADIGYERVRETIMMVGRKRGIDNKGVYLRRCLLNMIELSA